MTKRFHAIVNDGDVFNSVFWQVLDNDGFCYATFFGKCCGQYAREHAKRLNALPKKDQPGYEGGRGKQA